MTKILLNPRWLTHILIQLTPENKATPTGLTFFEQSMNLGFNTWVKPITKIWALKPDPTPTSSAFRS